MAANKVLKGTRAIAEFLEVNRGTAWQWIMAGVIPAALTPGGKWFTTTGLIETAIAQRSLALVASRQSLKSKRLGKHVNKPSPEARLAA